MSEAPSQEATGQEAPPPREDRRQQPKPPKAQLLKPETAAKKLGIYLPAAPESFRAEPVTRIRLNELLADPPEWLVTLRRDGPHPRSEVAHKLGVSNSGLARAGVSDTMTTAQIKALLAAPPAWLVTERARQAAVRATQSGGGPAAGGFDKHGR